MTKKSKEYRNKPCPHCGHYTNRAITVDALVLNEEGKVFLIKRGNEPEKGKWALPGGFVDWDETVEEAVSRELKEELGLTSKSLELAGIFSNPPREPHQNIALVYFIKANGVPKAGDDALDFRAFDLDDLPQNLAFDHKQIIEKFKSNFAEHLEST